MTFSIFQGNIPNIDIIIGDILVSRVDTAKYIWGRYSLTKNRRIADIHTCWRWKGMVYYMRIIGRDEELRELDGYLQSGKPEFLVVYGRRRVGKTFLIREHFQDELFFSHTGLANGSTKIQLAEFNKSLRRVRGETHRNAADWLEAFDCLREHIEQSGS